MAMNETTGTYPLSELSDFTVADSDIDPRGWDVSSSDNVSLGTVKELLVDIEDMKVRYLAIELDQVETDDEELSVLVPIGRARLMDDDDRVVIAALAEQVIVLPAYELGGRISREQENAVLRRFGSDEAVDDASFYKRDEYDTERFYGSRFMGDGSPDSRRPLADADDDLVDNGLDPIADPRLKRTLRELDERPER